MRHLIRIISLFIIASYISGCGGDISVKSSREDRLSASGKASKGTQRPYRINGKWYTPVESAYGFEERGIASWYGRDFHGKKTSNGETYNMHAMTAAHKTLPMNTYVKVRRVDNGAETIVRINDRGPFVSGRIIDLSYSAAKEIGIVDEGTAKVMITALGSARGDSLVKQDYSRGNFYVQVGAFTVKENAYRLRDKLARVYGRAITSEFYHNRKTFYRVRIGPVGGMNEANRISDKVARQGVGTPFIVGD